MDEVSRRAALTAGVGLAAGALLSLPGCSRGDEGEEVSATEDLMREHGVLRRVLVVYRSTATTLRTSNAKIDLAALGQAAALFRTFGEDYHEKKLEEEHIFPAVQKAGGEAGALVSTLLAQHARGREITAFVEAKCKMGVLGATDGAPLADALDGFARMYEAHAAFEDTIIFQAWKKTMSEHDLKEAGEQFEDIEKAQFKGDGFDLAIEQIKAIETRLGLNDLSRYTAGGV